LNRTNAVYKLLNSGGKWVSVVWQTNTGQVRKLNGKLSKVTKKRKNQDKIYGYLTMYDSHKQGFRRVNTRTITEIAVQKKRYKIK
jgi:hypothetical protein